MSDMRTSIVAVTGAALLAIGALVTSQLPAVADDIPDVITPPTATDPGPQQTEDPIIAPPATVTVITIPASPRPTGRPTRRPTTTTTAP